jgi:hypothetical protein
MSRNHLASLALLLAVVPAAWASDPVGIYAVIERAELEPSTGAPERVRLWGAFALAQGRGDTYAPPVRGVMYFALKKGKEEVCRKEWADLKKLAGQRQVVAFGARYAANGTVRKKAGDPTKAPDVYPLGVGLTKVPADGTLARSLLDLVKSSGEGAKDRR